MFTENSLTASILIAEWQSHSYACISKTVKGAKLKEKKVLIRKGHVTSLFLLLQTCIVLQHYSIVNGIITTCKETANLK